jgi:Xaa-Pro dipeptidase
MPTRRDFLRSTAAATAVLPLGARTLIAQAAPASALPKPLAELPNRAHDAVPITVAERQTRVDRARQLMAERKIAALVLTGNTSLVYFTGIHYWQSERMFAWVLPVTGAPYIVCPAFEEGRMTEQLTQMPDGRQTRIFTWNEDEDPYTLLTKNLSVSGPIALDERTPFVFADRIAQADVSRKVVSGIPIVAGCREIKSPAELALLQLANEVTLAVYKAAYQSGAPGMTTHAFSDMIAAGFSQSGFEGDGMCETAEWSALPHGSIKPQVIRENQVVLIDSGCSVEGYMSDMSRTFVYGRPTDKQKRVFDIVHQAQAAAVAAARTGIPCQAIDAAARKVITEAGFGPDYRTFSHRLGHGIGMDGHEWPYLVRGNAQPLQTGMCFSDEPGIYLTGEFGVRLEDCWHVTETGGALFTPQSPSLEHPFG